LQGVSKEPLTLREADLLSAEERALALQMADRLISLYEERDEALAEGDLDRVHEIQDQINEIAAQRQEMLATVTG
jgi:gamma-glutamyl phosphate reductase